MIGCLVLAYNEENYIEEILTEISDTFDKIIVVNDASTDKTADKIKNLDWRSVVIWECETKNMENLRDKIIDVFS